MSSIFPVSGDIFPADGDRSENVMLLPYRMLVLALPLATQGLLASAQLAAAQPVCAGPNPEPHAYGNLTFRTTSRIEPMPMGRFPFGVISCSDNPDPHNPLYVRWLIPGPHGYALPGGTLESTARLREDDRAPQLKGCLFYGDRPDETSGTFLGVDGDEKRAEFEKQRGCAVAVAETGKPVPIEGFVLKVRNNFPSDKASPAATMLHLEGEVGVEPFRSDGFRSVFRYHVSRTAGSEGIPGDVILRPAFRGPTEAFLPVFRKLYPEDVRFGEAGVVSFEITGLKSVELQYATYGIFDRERRVVAGIDVPLFVPVR